MTSLFLPFFNFKVSSIRTAYFPGASLFLDSLLSLRSKRFRAVSGKEERGTRNEERERGVQIVGTGACFEKRTRGKRGEISSRFFFLVIFSPALLGSLSLFWILLRHPARSRLT